MTDEISNRDQLLAEIEESVKTKVGDEWSEDSWTKFVKDVAWWLHSKRGRTYKNTIDAAAGLVKYGITKEDDLIEVAGSPPNKKEFREALEAKGVPPIVCDILFETMAVPAAAERERGQKALEAERERGQKALEAGQKALEAGQKALEAGQKALEAGQKALEAERERGQKVKKALENGTFFTPIDKVWGPEADEEYAGKGAFARMCRAAEYYENVDNYRNIVREAQAAAKTALASSHNTVSEILAGIAIEGGDSAGKSAGSNKKPKKKTGRRRNSKGNARPANANNSPANEEKSNNDEEPDNVSGLGSESSLLSESGSNAVVSETGSNISTGSGLANPDCFGRRPSSRAHMVPNSDCYPSYGLCCAKGVCGVTGDLTGDLKFLRSLAEGMRRSPFNFLRAPAVHGECYDAKPVWIFVPICELDFIKEWHPSQPYWVMAIAGGLRDCQQPVSVEDAYASLCTGEYHDADKTPCYRLKCTKSDIRTATERLREMVLALADTLFGADEGTITPLTLQEQGHGGGGGGGGSVRSGRHKSAPPKPRALDPKVDVLKKAIAGLSKDGVKLPKLIDGIDFEGVELVKFLVGPNNTDLYPDPWLLLMKAAINWSWRCGQKLYPACRSVHSEEEEEEGCIVPSTPIPAIIKCGPLPVTPDSGDDLSV